MPGGTKASSAFCISRLRKSSPLLRGGCAGNCTAAAASGAGMAAGTVTGCAAGADGA